MRRVWPVVGCVIGLLVGAAPAGAEYHAKGKRDPLVPLLTTEGQRIHPPGLDEEAASGIAQLALQGIVFDPKAESYAIVNGRIVHEQETIDGMVVLRIQPTTVTMLVEGRPRELSIAPPAAQDTQEGTTP